MMDVELGANARAQSPEDALFPSEAEIDAKVRELHAKPHKVVVFHTGAGAGIPQLLWAPPPASATILESRFTYVQASTDAAIGRKLEKYCEREAAIALAVAAYTHGRALLEGTPQADDPVIGLGLTAAVRSAEIKRGEHRVHIATKGEKRISVVTVTLQKGNLTRIGEGRLCDLLGLNTILRAAGIADVPLNAALGMTATPAFGDRGDGRRVLTLDLIGILGGATANPDLFARPVLWPDDRRGTLDELHPDRHILFPGSFNPKHPGHDGIAIATERATGKTVVAAITQHHPQKGPISVDELLRRAQQFAWERPVVLTEHGSLYIDKARMFPGFAFAIGADALLGLLNPKYYGSASRLTATLEEFGALGTRFYVTGRVHEGTFMTAEQAITACAAAETLDLRHLLGTLFLPVTGRWDVSSTHIRTRQASR
ncbi:hypothetical protein HY632_04205 [Candidatus Uhrbacteria bacterium]|nr:hypothetical protein [Candidatus Uhrbacteria bacterium]